MSQKTRRRSTSTIPFGWRLHPENEHLLVEEPDEQECLEFVKTIKDSYSLQVIANVIKARTGRHMSPEGVRKMFLRGY